MYDHRALKWIDEHGGLVNMPETEPRLQKLRKSVNADINSNHTGPRAQLAERNKIIEYYVKLAQKNKWTKAETIYRMNKESELTELVTESQVESYLQYLSTKFPRNMIDVSPTDQKAIDQLIIHDTNKGHSIDRIALTINNMDYGFYVDASYVKRRKIKNKVSTIN